MIPISSDAPVYHRPYATLGLIAANCYSFYLTGGGEFASGWLLTFGNGLHPTEWLLSAFLHYGLGHLVGNMIFLWAYGMIIEGKLGALRFLALYISITLVDSALIQALMLSYDGVSPGAGGASGAIFGLLAVAAVWAPRNSFQVIWFLGFGVLARAGTFEISVLTFSAWYIGTDLFMSFLNGFQISTPTLHVAGAIVGAVFGWLFLKQKWVDCEGWDLLTLWQKEDAFGVFNRMSQTTNNSRRREQPVRKAVVSLRTIEELVDRGRYRAACQQYLEILKDRQKRYGLDRKSLKALIDVMCRQKCWEETVALLEDYLSRFPDDTGRAQLMLAAIQVREQSRPKRALSVVAALDPDRLHAADRQLLRQIQKAANDQIKAGVLEPAFR